MPWCDTWRDLRRGPMLRGASAARAGHPAQPGGRRSEDRISEARSRAEPSSIVYGAWDCRRPDASIRGASRVRAAVPMPRVMGRKAFCRRSRSRRRGLAQPGAHPRRGRIISIYNRMAPVSRISCAAQQAGWSRNAACQACHRPAGSRLCCIIYGEEHGEALLVWRETARAQRAGRPRAPRADTAPPDGRQSAGTGRERAAGSRHRRKKTPRAAHGLPGRANILFRMSVFAGRGCLASRCGSAPTRMRARHPAGPARAGPSPPWR